MAHDLAESAPGDQRAATLLAVVTARICHDLANPIGAIGNGMELVRELGPEATTDELEMVGRSVDRATATLAALRLAFGGAPGGSPMASGKVAGRMEPYLVTRRVSFECAGEATLGPDEAQLAALMVMAARGLLGLEGRLRLSVGDGAALPLTAEALGPRAAWSDELRALAFDSGPPEARTVEFALLPQVSRSAGVRLEPIEEDGRAGLRAVAA